MSQPPRLGAVYAQRFLQFQFSKYAGLGAVIALMVTALALKQGAWVSAAGIGFVAGCLAVATFRMANGYRCPAPGCNQLLIFAHGTSAVAGPSTHTRTCPFCNADLT